MSFSIFLEILTLNLCYNCSSGLAAAYKLKSHGFDVTVFEAEGRAGGKLRSVSHDGLIWDEGANTMVNFVTCNLLKGSFMLCSSINAGQP